ncbi:hypothetical protein [Legionella fairfieldensis]|uniref:hypothetical protein n=1 Tax=Legionella fairfieldensis TaxID=45064 RepID=UPI000A9E97D7|nr:hypothetical protein [Legionella fairfieldensis]
MKKHIKTQTNKSGINKSVTDEENKKIRSNKKEKALDKTIEDTFPASDAVAKY